VTTGVYEPEEENNEATEEDQGEGDEQVEEDGQEEEDENTNNNALNRSEEDEARIEVARNNRRSKHKVEPKPPTSGILVVLYGDRGKTQILPLLSSAPGGVSSFLPGSADEFKVNKFLVSA